MSFSLMFLCGQELESYLSGWNRFRVSHYLHSAPSWGSSHVKLQLVPGNAFPRNLIQYMDDKPHPPLLLTEDGKDLILYMDDKPHPPPHHFFWQEMAVYQHIHLSRQLLDDLHDASFKEQSDIGEAWVLMWRHVKTFPYYYPEFNSHTD